MVFSSYVPPSPAGLVEDIAEFLTEKERLHDSTNVDSLYETDSSVAQQNDSTSAVEDKKRTAGSDSVDQPSNKKARKSLETTWDNTTQAPDSYLVETPVSFFFVY